MLKKMFGCFGASVSEGSPRRTVEPPLSAPYYWLDDSVEPFHLVLGASPSSGTPHASDCIIIISPLPNCTACSEAVNQSQTLGLGNMRTSSGELTDTSEECSDPSNGCFKDKQSSHKNPHSPQQMREASQACQQAESGTQHSSACSASWPNLYDELCDDSDSWQPEDLNSTSRFSCESNSSLTRSMLMIEV